MIYIKTKYGDKWPLAGTIRTYLKYAVCEARETIRNPKRIFGGMYWTIRKYQYEHNEACHNCKLVQDCYDSKCQMPQECKPENMINRIKRERQERRDRITVIRYMEYEGRQRELDQKIAELLNQ